ncbi:MAG: ArsC/Spx/MgsR family protein [Plesiomonas shigelloides]
MVAHPALIKRPLLAHNGQYWLGFKEADYQQVFYPAN